VNVQPDTKPAKPIRDRTVFVLFHDQPWACVNCGRDRQIVAHHIVHRGQGGDDVMANLAPLCDPCHGAYHGNPYKHKGKYVNETKVKQALIRHILGDREDTQEYLLAKWGAFGLEAFVQMLEGKLKVRT
jgi:HNH endonuclease